MAQVISKSEAMKLRDENLKNIDVLRNQLIQLESQYNGIVENSKKYRKAVIDSKRKIKLLEIKASKFDRLLRIGIIGKGDKKVVVNSAGN